MVLSSVRHGSVYLCAHRSLVCLALFGLLDTRRNLPSETRGARKIASVVFEDWVWVYSFSLTDTPGTSLNEEESLGVRMVP